VKMPRVTVATVVLNAARDLPLTIESILGQTYPHIDTLVVDGYSWDDTQAVLERYCDRLGQILKIEDGGIYQAMNIAAQVADGDYLLFLNAGDRFYREDAVEAVVARMSGNPDLVYGDHVYVERRVERFVRSSDFDLLWQRLRDGRIDHDWHLAIPCHQATFTRTRLLREMPYDTRYGICADHDFLFRARARGAVMQYVDEIVAHYVAGGMSGMQGARIHREWAHAYRKHSLRPLAVDSFFFGSPEASPFPSFSAGSGNVQQGAAIETRTEDGRRWRWANGLVLNGPALCETVGLYVRGASRVADQMLVFRKGEDLLGAERLPRGEFELRSAFITPLAAGHEIALDAQILGRAAEIDSWGFETLHFIPCPLMTGKELDLLWSDAEQVSNVFLDGWHPLESNNPDQECRVWSNLEQASLALGLEEPVEMLTLHLEGHAAAGEGQDLSVVVNGTLVGAVHLEAGRGSRAYSFTVAGAWRKGANIVRLCLDQMAYDTARHRRVGFGLSRIEWR